MSDDPTRIGSRLLDVAVGVLLAATALYGAVAIVQSIWVFLCIALAVVAVVWLAAWFFVSRFRRW